MSINFNRGRFNKSHNSKEYKRLLMSELYPIYWDEGIYYRKGILSFKYRMYRSWKHNRKNQYGENG